AGNITNSLAREDFPILLKREFRLPLHNPILFLGAADHIALADPAQKTEHPRDHCPGLAQAGGLYREFDRAKSGWDHGKYGQAPFIRHWERPLVLHKRIVVAVPFGRTRERIRTLAPQIGETGPGTQGEPLVPL